MYTTELLKQWLVGIRIAHIQQFLASNHSEKMNRRLGVPTVVLGALVGTSVFANLEVDPDVWVKIVIGLLSIASAVLAALQTFMVYGEKTSNHKTSAIKYGKLRRELEQYIAARVETNQTDEAFMRDFRNLWDEVDEAAPTTAQAFHQAAREQVNPSKR
jgi:Protein of unknown function (DUF4231)